MISSLITTQHLNCSILLNAGVKVHVFGPTWTMLYFQNHTCACTTVGQSWHEQKELNFRSKVVQHKKKIATEKLQASMKIKSSNVFSIKVTAKTSIVEVTNYDKKNT